jgi:Na+/proline symporter
MTILLSFGFLTAILLFVLYYGKNWAGTTSNFLFADRSLKIASSGLAINSHWFWAIAMFVAPAAAYNWGIVGLLWFVIPNALSLIVAAALTYHVRNKYPEGYSLTEFITNNFSHRVSLLYQVSYAVVSLAGILLGFTAITKYFAFTGLGEIVDPIYASLVVGLITLGFTIRGGIRTSIYTGTLQTILWIIFLGGMMAGLVGSGFDFNVLGKNQLTTVFDEKFLTTFGIAYLISIITGATMHGMMWQKSFSMPKENIWPSYIIATVIFALVVFSLGSFGLYAQAHGLTIKGADLSSLAGIFDLYGPLAITAFGVLLIGQTSTVMDSCMNYIGSLASREWLNKDDTTTAKLVMAGFFLLAWLISWSKIEIWTIYMFMAAVRISMFVPLLFQVYQIRMKEAIIFYGSFVGISGAIYLSYLARELKNPVYDMYYVFYAVAVSILACLLATALAKRDETI